MARSGPRTPSNIKGDVVDKDKQPYRQTERTDVRNAGLRLVRQETVVLLVDLVESVRLMREHEASTVRRWAEFINVVRAEILPRYDGEMVKSLGDGVMARFETVPDAVDAASEMHRVLAERNVGIPHDQHFYLRAGVNAAMAWSDGIDYYGTGVNLAARLATLAGPGETLPGQRRMSDSRPRWPALPIPARPSEVPRRAMSLRTGWMRYARTSGNAFSSTLTNRSAHIGSGPQVPSQVSSGGATMVQPWNLLSL
jgi:class 3 adenylate cyclase